MDAQLPFCEECGAVGAMLSGVHPAAGGTVYWTIYRCGHTKTELHLEGVPSGDEPDLLPARASGQPAHTPTGS